MINFFARQCHFRTDEMAAPLENRIRLVDSDVAARETVGADRNSPPLSPNEDEQR